MREHHAPDPLAFVAGATGYVGREVVRELRERGTRTVAHVRPDSPHLPEWRARFEALGAEVDVTAWDETSFAARFAVLAPTHVFACHGTTRSRARRDGIDDPYQTVDVGLTRILVTAAASTNPTPRIVYLSSMGARAGSGGSYLAARGRAEEVVRGGGVHFTICRAPLLTTAGSVKSGGTGRDEHRTGEQIAGALLGPSLRLVGRLGLGRLRDRYHPMDAREAAEGLVRSGFHYMTIDRVVLADELRSEGVYEREITRPRSKRDEGRH